MSQVVAKVREKSTCGVDEKPADTVGHDRWPKPEGQNRVSHDGVGMQSLDPGV